MKTLIFLGLSLVATFVNASSNVKPIANEPALVTVNWQSPEDYQDIRPAQELRSNFHRRTFAEFNRIFEDLSSDLPEGYRWEVTVTNVDLAGEVRPTQGMSGGLIRVVRPIFFPQMSLGFKVYSAKNDVVLAESVVVKDMNFSNRIRRVRMNDPLFFERAMLKRWFKRDVIARLTPQ